MPIDYVRALTGRERTLEANRQLGFVLAFVAGAMNAGGFLALGQYTSHMTGIVSSIADNLALGHLRVVVDGLVALASFLAGAATCAVMINIARRKRMRSTYALPLLLESALILCFGLLGATLSTYRELLVPFTVVMLCFMMGLQNAVVTKLSNAVIRTTHVTGIVTDLGIELGKLVYWNRSESAGDERGSPIPVRADRDRILVLAGLLLFFASGGIVGALGFARLGYVSTVPLAVLLATLAVIPALDDLRAALRARRRT